MKPESSFTVATSDSLPEGPKTAFVDYLTLTKPEITFLVTISAIGGFILGSSLQINVPLLVALIFGVAFSASGGAALNLFIEREEDAKMKRTTNRPLPGGRIHPLTALILGCLLSLLGLTILFVFVNTITCVLSGITLLLYLFLYTPLKQQTKYNTLIGTVPGALPALGGWTAATDSLGGGGWVFFGILLVWQLPHFYALAWMYRKDYERAGFKMLPVVEPGGRSTIEQTLFASVLLFILSLCPSLMGLTGAIYLIGALTTSSWVVINSIVFYRTMSGAAARKVLKATILHIPILVISIIIDHFV